MKYRAHALLCSCSVLIILTFSSYLEITLAKEWAVTQKEHIAECPEVCPLPIVTLTFLLGSYCPERRETCSVKNEKPRDMERYTSHLPDTATTEKSSSYYTRLKSPNHAIFVKSRLRSATCAGIASLFSPSFSRESVSSLPPCKTSLSRATAATALIATSGRFRRQLNQAEKACLCLHRQVAEDSLQDGRIQKITRSRLLKPHRAKYQMTQPIPLRPTLRPIAMASTSTQRLL